MEKYVNILENFLSLKDEYEWLDFKENWFSKDEIGEYISAISNGAALCGKENGYIVWGIKDKTKEKAELPRLFFSLWKTFFCERLLPSSCASRWAFHKLRAF